MRGNHLARFSLIQSDKKMTFGAPGDLPDGVVRPTGSALQHGTGGEHRVKHGHPLNKVLAMNAAGVQAGCSMGDARGWTCTETRQVKGPFCKDGKCLEPEDRGFIMASSYGNDGGRVCEEEAGNSCLLPRPPGKGWVFVIGKHSTNILKNKGLVPEEPLWPNHGKPPRELQTGRFPYYKKPFTGRWKRHTAVCISLPSPPSERSKRTKAAECGGNGMWFKPNSDGHINHCKPEGANGYRPPSKRVSLEGQMVAIKTVKGAKLGDSNTDRYLITYQVDKSLYYYPDHIKRINDPSNKTKELWIAEVDGDCNIKLAPEQVALPEGHRNTKPVLHEHMDLTTTTNGLVVWAMPNNDGQDGKGGTLLFTYRCQTC
eukprot:gnl/MRDRNA2_/MRDRNA2_71870_c0_seq2.p1 gnl/MRDRNA2_/MRDRNA2_71870_c0~~gnl/MRDRNA2_/MRDRNA2_71870_c0_seq2.p1  ORF type:complete len:397 (-),score=49.73 gnl/MRDRNA2_/MRDRNA2_71870_c0_seq2:184-1296(-)